MKNTASTTRFAIILQLQSNKVVVNILAIEKAGNSILELEHWLNQIRDITIEGGPSEAILSLVQDGKKEALELKKDIFKAIGTAEYVLRGFASKAIQELKDCVRNIVLGYKRAYRVLKQVLKKEKQIVD